MVDDAEAEDMPMIDMGACDEEEEEECPHGTAPPWMGDDAEAEDMPMTDMGACDGEEEEECPHGTDSAQPDGSMYGAMIEPIRRASMSLIVATCVSLMAVILYVWMNQRDEMIVTNTCETDVNGVVRIMGNSMLGFAIGVPGIPGLWDNIVMGAVGACIGVLQPDKLLAVEKLDIVLRRGKHSLINRTKTFLGRLNCTGQALPERFNFFGFEK